MGLHVQFAHQFGLTIDAVGTGILVLRIGCIVSAVEHIVGRNLYHPTATLPNGIGQIGRCLGIQFLTKFLVFLGFIDGGIGGTVDNAVNQVFIDKSFYGLLVSNVQFSHVCIIPTMLGILRLQQLHFIS